jgi:hypothetical protein
LSSGHFLGCIFYFYFFIKKRLVFLQYQIETEASNAEEQLVRDKFGRTDEKSKERTTLSSGSFDISEVSIMP